MDYLSKNVRYFLQDYLRFFKIVDYLHYLRHWKLFVGYLKHGLFEIIYLWIFCGLFKTWII